MSVDPAKIEHPEAREDLDRARLRLFDAAASLKPIDGPDELIKRVRAVARELQVIQEDLLLYVHCAALESGDFGEVLDSIDANLGDPDWRPEGAPVEDVIDRLRSNLSKSA
jgi:hypothetical protein